MSKDLTSNNIEKDEFNLNSEENDYEILMSRLKEIKITITLLEKNLFS